MSNETTPEIDDNEPPVIAPDAEEQRPTLPTGDYQGTLQRWKQAAFTYTTKDGEETARYDDISVKVVHPTLGICFAQTSAFDNQLNTNFAPKSNSSAEKFRKAFGVTGFTTAQLTDMVGDASMPVRVKVVSKQRKDRKNLDSAGKPSVVIEALIAGIWRDPGQE